VPTVARVVVDVMLKPEILDPQGQAIVRALPSLGFDAVRGVRQGKHFELDVDGPDAESIGRQVAETLLANPVIEDFTVSVTDSGVTSG
jgi:phosphoribosylformylglycinamidine synthase subunit PurS